jgi:hypothetical protein
MTALFVSKVSVFGPRLMHDFGLTAEDAAAVYGNIGHESSGFTAYHEDGQKASRGGVSWCQWTGARRHAFEAWCHTHGLDVRSDAAGYGYLCFELRGSERGAIAAIKRHGSLEAKVAAFEAEFERARVKAIARRVTWAKLALSTIHHVMGTTPAVPKATAPMAKKAKPRAAAKRPAGRRR